MSEHHRTTVLGSAPDPVRFLTREACRDLLTRVANAARGGGNTWISAESDWTGNLRWARNQVISAGDVRTMDVRFARTIRGARSGVVSVNRIDDASLDAAMRRAERILNLRDEMPPDTPDRLPPETPTNPTIWSDVTYNLDADQRAAILPPLLSPAMAAGMVTAGYIEVAAHGRTVEDDQGLLLYHPYTAARYTVTVRSPDGSGSGWAGIDHYDWRHIDPAKLSAIALDKCLRSRNPVAVEPGRYTTILEPQAVCDLFAGCFSNNSDFLRETAESDVFGGPYWSRPNFSKIGERILDERLSVSSDPMDPECGFPPFGREGDVYYAVRWVENGVLKALPYNRRYAIEKLGKDTSLPNSESWRMSGGTTSLDEMIATTKRGVYVTRFSNVEVVDPGSLLQIGYTRDGTWLIENGKITHPIKNFRFTESPFFVGNQIDQLGVPQRVFHPGAPVIAPSMKVRDFNFSQLSDAI